MAASPSARDARAAGPRQSIGRLAPGFPLCFLGYGALYAWGYVLWETAALSTEAVSGVEYDLSWLVSAVAAPLAFALLALAGLRREVERSRACPIAAPVLAFAGSVLSVVYQHVPAGLAAPLAVASGVCTAVASALFLVLWSLAFARLGAGVLEVLVPVSFSVSLVCALVAPAMEQLPALVFSLLLVAACTAGLFAARRKLAAGAIDPRFLEERAADIDATAEERPFDIARMLVYGIVAWSLCSFAPCLVGVVGAEADAAALDTAVHGGIDIVSCAGYLLAIAFALAIIRYAVRVDFLALALMTLAPFVLSLALYAFEGPFSVLAASVLNVAMSACCEMILFLYFVRLAQNKGRHRAFWVALGSSAGYIGVLIGHIAGLAFTRAPVTVGERPLWCLGIICVYVLAMLLIPQRRPYRTLGAPVPAPVVSSVQASPLQPLAAPDAVAAAAVAPDGLDAACARIAERYQLSPREAEICSYLARGRSQTYIRDALFLSKNTVSTHTRHLYAKLDVHSKQELIDLVEQSRTA